MLPILILTLASHFARSDTDSASVQNVSLSELNRKARSRPANYHASKTLSLCMIVKNEEDVLENCLKTVPFVDEIIIVDTGSTDRTKEIAYRYTDKVYDFQWVDDFSAARTFSFSKATKDYILWLDADDVIPEENLDEWWKQKAELSDKIDVVVLPYHRKYNNPNEPTFSLIRERIARNCPLITWHDPVHESFPVFGNTIHNYKCVVLHNKTKPNPPKRNLNILDKYIANGNTLSPRLTYYYGQELFENDRPAEAIEYFEKYLTYPNLYRPNVHDAYMLLSESYRKTSQKEKAIQTLARSISVWGKFHPKVAYLLGNEFLNNGSLIEAKYWYKLALANKDNRDMKTAIYEPDYFTFYPSMQLAVVYDKLGKYDKGAKYNAMAGAIHPDNNVYQTNARYFATKGMLTPATVLTPLESVAVLSHTTSSFVRFSDCDFSILLGSASSFQQFNPDLQAKLTAIIRKPSPNILFAIPAVFASFDRVVGFAGGWWRNYVKSNPKVREFINTSETYLDSFLSSWSFHTPVRSDVQMTALYNTMRDIWKGKSLVIVMEEDIGQYHFDIFDNAQSKRLISAPHENAFAEYDRLLKEITSERADCVILLDIGPTANVLVAELARQGYRALALGHAAKDYDNYHGGSPNYRNSFTRD
jgi:glycosyltransferase involved in cell wall biosynthesis